MHPIYCMYITRKAEFSASHVCRLPTLSDEENRMLFGENANPHGHGHNYVFEVTVEGTPDPKTGMIMDLKQLKQILEEQVVEPMDHRFLNHEVPPFSTVVPTTENVAQEIWRRIEPVLKALGTRLYRVRLFETPDMYVDVLHEAVA